MSADQGGHPGTPDDTSNLEWIKYADAGDGGDGAEVSGVIVSVDGCLGIDRDDSDDRAIILLAFSVKDERPASLAEGDKFVGAGGEIPAPKTDDFEYPASCSTTGSVFVVSMKS